MNQSKNLKHKEAKLHTSRVESYIKGMKEVTPNPKIDSLSRKIAELITKKELEVLGIDLTERVSKKPNFSVSILNSSPKAKKKNSSTCITQDLTKQVTPRSDFKAILTFPPTVPEPSQKTILEKAQKEEMISNLQHLEALKEELHRDYPELELNNSCEGSSFHTNELHELEENCRNDEKADSKAVTEVKEERGSDAMGKEVVQERQGDKVGEGITKPESAEQEDLAFKPDTKLAKKKNLSCGFISHSKNPSLMSSGTKPDFCRSYMKASLLHSAQESISTVVPRCHVDIKSCITTPVYLNKRVPKGSRVKNPNGVGPADCLRKLLLRVDEEEKLEKNDFFSRNSKWLKNKDDKNLKLQKDKEIRNMKECTFDPYFHKKKASLDLTKKGVIHRTHISVSSEKQDKDSKPRNTMKYSGITPAEHPISYLGGIDRQKFIEKAEPLIVYTQVNSLK